MQELREAAYAAAYHFSGRREDGILHGRSYSEIIDFLRRRYSIELVQVYGRCGREGYNAHEFRYRGEMFVYDTRYEHRYVGGSVTHVSVSGDGIYSNRSVEYSRFQKEIYGVLLDPTHYQPSKELSIFFGKMKDEVKNITKLKEKQKRKEKYEKEKKIKTEYEALCKETEREVKDYKKVSMFTIEREISEMKAEKDRHVLTMENLKSFLGSDKMLNEITENGLIKLLNFFTKY